ncbi:DUF6233 domain-containing protein [Streptomyces olindensis]|uniref:DUF6233 domain-containing protein n=1 Tax=Streptomyces olindensis TaxID=358823 RepID=A0ABV2Y5J7_9ACTN
MQPLLLGEVHGRRKIADLQRREAEREHGRRPACQAGVDRPGPRRRLLRSGQPPRHHREEARRLLASGVPACPHCQPDTELRILD